MDTTYDETIGRAGLLTGLLVVDQPGLAHLAVMEADHVEAIELPDGRVGILAHQHNAYVRTGLRNALLREALGTGTSWAGFGVSSDNTAVTENTRFLAGAAAGVPGSAGSGGNIIVKPITGVTVSAITDGATQTATGGATFTQTDFATGGMFAIRKIGILLSSTVDADGNLVDVIGGAGASPYNKPLNFDLVALVAAGGTFSLGLSIAVTAIAV